MSVKKPEPKFGKVKPEEIIVWHNEDYEPVSKYVFHGDYEGAPPAAKAFAAFIKWYEESLVPTSEQVERELDDEAIAQIRTCKFEWAQSNNPHLTYEEWLARHRISSEQFRVEDRTLDLEKCHPEKVLEDHFLFATFESDSPDE